MIGDSAQRKKRTNEQTPCGINLYLLYVLLSKLSTVFLYYLFYSSPNRRNYFYTLTYTSATMGFFPAT